MATMPSNLSKEARAYYDDFLKREDVQARPGLKKGLEDLLAGIKPTKRKKGQVIKGAMPNK
jgi:hypothetical protein